MYHEVLGFALCYASRVGLRFPPYLLHSWRGSKAPQQSFMVLTKELQGEDLLQGQSSPANRHCMLFSTAFQIHEIVNIDATHTAVHDMQKDAISLRFDPTV